VGTGTLLNRPNRRDAELQLELAGAFSLLLSACTRAKRLMTQARERGIEPKLSPEVDALIKLYDAFDVAMSMQASAPLDLSEQIQGN
jgi:hypothetical protein